jgi:hypothetical protein
VLLYLELFACCVDFLILDGDNLAALFPGAGAGGGWGLLGLRLSAQQAMTLLAAGAVLPTVLLRDMSALSYVSVRRGGAWAGPWPRCAQRRLCIAQPFTRAVKWRLGPAALWLWPPSLQGRRRRRVG